MPKKIDPELRARAVRLVLEHQQEYPSVTEAMIAVAKQLGGSRESVRRWVSQAAIDAGRREGMSSQEHEEIKRLKAENRRLREDVAVLKAATTLFAGELIPGGAKLSLSAAQAKELLKKVRQPPRRARCARPTRSSPGRFTRTPRQSPYASPDPPTHLGL